MAIPRLDKTLRSANRYREILTVLVRYGFEDVVSETGLDRWIGFGKSLIGGARPERAEPRAVRLRQALEDLGPTFIKLGQILSTRPDLIPPDWAEEFKKLQDDCAKLDYAVIEQRLAEEFPGPRDALFASIEAEPLAAASIAQVHRATLADGTRVVLKVLRPGIRQTIEADMGVLTSIAEFVERHFEELGYSPTKVVREFDRELQKEVDLTCEGRATDRFRKDFADDSSVTFPKVYWEATTRNVLTLEEIDGVLLSRMGANQLNQAERTRLVKVGVNAVFKQCLEYGYFHADPHPGNIFALPDGRVCFIDCGMTGHIDRRTSDELADLVVGVASGDLERVIEVAIALAGADPSITDDRSFRADAWLFVSRFENATLDTLDLGSLLQDFFDLLREYKLQCPADLVFLIKAITTIEGVGELLDPSFDLVSHVKPHIEGLVARRYGFRAIRGRLEKGFLRYAQLAEDLPREVQSLLGQLRNNRFSINLEHRRLDRITETIEHASRNVSYALGVAALLVGSTILILADRGTEGGVFWKLGVVGLAICAGLSMARMMANYRYKRKR